MKLLPTDRHDIGKTLSILLVSSLLAACGSTAEIQASSPSSSYGSSSSHSGQGEVLTDGYIADAPSPVATTTVSPPIAEDTASSAPVAVDANTSGRLSVPSIGVDASLLTMTVTDGTIEPPTHTDAYVIDAAGWGRPGNTDGLSAVLAFHSGRGVEALGNSFLDISTGKSTLNAGDMFAADGIAYVVEDVLYILKDELPTTDALYEVKPGRLLLITCLARPSGKSVNNIVVVAQQVA